MTTPAIILGLLMMPRLLGGLFASFCRRPLTPSTATSLGCLGLTLVFCFTGVGHFIKTEPMAGMLPSWFPGRVPLVYLTGVLEIAAAIAVFAAPLRRRTGWLLIGMLVLFLPANIYAAVNHTGMGGHQWGPVYLLIRIPLQAILIGWTWWFAVREDEQDIRQQEDRRATRRHQPPDP